MAEKGWNVFTVLVTYSYKALALQKRVPNKWSAPLNISG